MRNFEHLKILANSDSSFAYLTNGGYQGGYMDFFVGRNNKYLLIAWQSKCIRKVVKSTLTAKTLAMVDISEACLFYRNLLLEWRQLKDDTKNIKIMYKTNNFPSLWFTKFMNTNFG